MSVIQTKMKTRRRLLMGIAVASALALGGFALSRPGHAAQAMHAQGDMVVPAASGQAAFGMIQQVVDILQSDPHTDWSNVNIDALRAHLIDMNDVMMKSVVLRKNVPGGLQMTITGRGRTQQAIRRMVPMHTVMLDAMPQWNARTTLLPEGARLTVTARNPKDLHTVQMIRGLGFAGLLAEGHHHRLHHMEMARGLPMTMPMPYKTGKAPAPHQHNMPKKP